MNHTKLKERLHKLQETFTDKESELTALDREIGDGDHGVNMKRGFNAVKEKVTDVDGNQEVLKQTGMTLMSSIGGASGPLYGYSFVKMSEVAKDEIDGDNLKEMLEVFSEAVSSRGNVTGGEKTMYDVISKASTLLEDKGRLDLENLQKLADDTENMVATKGRAAYFKEKSKGTIDPGAQSAVYILNAFNLEEE